MLVSTGLGDELVDDSGVDDSGLGLSDVWLTLGAIGVVGLVFVSVLRGGSSSSVSRNKRVKGTGSKTRRVTRRVETKASSQYKLEVDITGNGRWVEQATGSKREMGKVATQVKNQEGMKTRLVEI